MNDFKPQFVIFLGFLFFLIVISALVYGIVCIFTSEYAKATSIFTLLILFKVMQLKA